MPGQGFLFVFLRCRQQGLFCAKRLSKPCLIGKVSERGWGALNCRVSRLSVLWYVKESEKSGKAACSSPAQRREVRICVSKFGTKMVPGVGFEPTHLSASVFETDVSAVPPPGRNDEVYLMRANASRGKCQKTALDTRQTALVSLEFTCGKRRVF